MRYTVEPDDTTKTVRFHDFQDAVQVCSILDYSRTGISFILQDGSLLFKIGDVIPDLIFLSLDREIYHGDCTIIHIQDNTEEDEDLSVIGCTFNDYDLDIHSIIRVDKITQCKNEFLDFIQSMAVEDNLEPDFVHLTSHLHYVLKGFKERLDKEERTLASEEESIRPAMTETIRDLAYEALYEELFKYYDHFTEIISRFNDPKKHFIHREFFQSRLLALYRNSILFKRAYDKPLGYAGDFEMMNIIYKNAFEGEDIFSQIMGKIDNTGPASKAVRNRRTYLYKKIRHEVEHLGQGTSIKILSVACGPSLEFYDILKTLKGKPLPCRVEFIGMDQDTQALENSRMNIEPLAKKRDDISVCFVEDNIKRLIVGKTADPGEYTDSDIVYSAGLFDYLSEKASNRLIQSMYSFVKPGGLIIIGNFGKYNPQRFIMEYGSNWFLIHRSEEELKALAVGLPDDIDIKVEREPEGVNLFLNIRKPLE